MGILIGRLVSGKTKLDLIVVPFVTILTGALTAYLIAPSIGAFMTFLGSCINGAAELQTIPAGILLAVNGDYYSFTKQ